MMKRMIGISGKIGVGKTTLGDYLKTILNNSCPAEPYCRKDFADALKEECSRVYQYPVELNYTQEGKRTEVESTGTTVREILQSHGASCRAMYPDYWLRKMEDSIGNNTQCIVADIRYPNEVEWVKKMGGIVIRIYPHDQWEEGPNAEHESETALDDYTGWDILLMPKYGHLEDAARELIVVMEIV